MGIEDAELGIGVFRLDFDEDLDEGFFREEEEAEARRVRS